MDLPRGRLTSGEHPDRLLALPAAWIGELLECLPDGLDAFADRLVAPIATDVSEVLDDPQSALPEDLAYALSLAFARRGFGVVAFERWGDALLFVWRSPPSSAQGFREFAARLASRLIGELLGLRVRGVTLSGDSSALRVLLASPETCQEVRSLGVEGVAPEALLQMLTPEEAA